jgi:two-component system, NtrC family, sensor histidine kinase HydH
MTIKTLILLVAFFLNAALALGVLANNPKQRTNQTFFFIAAGVSLWNFATFMFWQTDAVLFWARMMFIGPTLIPSALLLFSISFPNNSNHTKAHQTALILSPWTVFIPISFSDIIVRSVRLVDREVYYGIGNGLFAIYFFSFTLLSFLILYKKFRTAQGISKSQLSYMFLGMTVSMFIGIMTNLVLPLIGTSKLNYVGPSATVIFVGLTAYAITKTRLMDISVIISKSIAYGITMAILGMGYLLLVSLYRMYISASIDVGFISLTIAYGIFVGFAFERLRMFIQTSSDKVFLKGKYDFKGTMSYFVNKLFKVVSLGELKEVFEKARLEIIESRILKVILLDSSRGPKELPDEMIEILSNSRNIEFVSDMKNKLKDVEFLVPCFSGDSFIAVLVVGKKLSEDPYKDDEIDVFRILAPQIATVIERIQPYEKVKEDYVAAQAMADKAMEMAEKMAQQAAFATLTRGIAHEIRNPMAIMLSRAEIAEKHLDDTAEMSKFAEMTKRSVLRLINITETMLKYGKAASTEKSRITVKSLLDDITLLAEGECRKREIEMAVDCPEQYSVTGDPNRLHQALLNIVINALQAIDKGGNVKIMVKESPYANRNGKTVSGVEISVKDSGCGISKENLSKIFDPFFTTKHECTGLGLSLVARIIDEHNGMMDVRSSAGEGTEFVVYLPA